MSGKNRGRRNGRAIPIIVRRARCSTFAKTDPSPIVEFRGLIDTVSAETLRLDLVDLVGKGILSKIGAKEGTYYVLKGNALAGAKEQQRGTLY